MSVTDPLALCELMEDRYQAGGWRVTDQPTICELMEDRHQAEGWRA